tara:strand:+ start:1138 stop:1281 length:144 start_codon:yes stop_codon:yes gene_type:complete
MINATIDLIMATTLYRFAAYAVIVGMSSIFIVACISITEAIHKALSK